MTDDPRARLYARYVTTHLDGGGTGAPEISLTRQVLPLLPAERASRILEVGCGSGALVGLLGRLGYHDVRGIDTSEEQVQLAHQRGLTQVQQADLREFLDSEDAVARFDVIVALDVLEHFTVVEILAVMDLIAGALRPGGRLIARTPNGASPFSGRYRYGDLTHGMAFTTSSLRQLLRTTGFRRWRFLPVSPEPHGPVSALRLAVWTVIAGAMKLALAAETGQLRGHIVTQNVMVCAER